MSTLYLVDLFGAYPPDPPPYAKVIDVHSGPNTPMTGFVAIRVPDYIQVANPVDVTDLITKKHLGMLAYYAGYANILFDDLLNTTSVDLTAPDTQGTFGERNNITIPGTTTATVFQSTLTALVGAPPPQVYVTWETYSVQVADGATSRMESTYTEEPSSPANFLCEVSFDNGVHFYPTTDGALLNIPLIGQGTQFIIRLTNNTAIPGPARSLRIGSWALIY